MNRRQFFVSTAAGLAALSFSNRQIFANNKAHRISKTLGWAIDAAFGRRERQILNDALAIFYQRFLQPYRPFDYVNNGRAAKVREWSNSHSDVTQRHINHFAAGTNERSMFSTDWTDMWRHFISDAKPFPRITLRHKNAPRGGFVAQAHYDMILINGWPNVQTHTSTGRNDGAKSNAEFDIDINDWYLANQAAGRHSFDPNYWAGVIAHEAWHNLGHAHPTSRANWNYYQHQIVLHEMCVMQNSSIRYGDQLGVPVYCRRHPG